MCRAPSVVQGQSRGHGLGGEPPEAEGVLSFKSVNNCKFVHFRYAVNCSNVLFTAHRCVSAVLAVAICLSVRLSVCLSVRPSDTRRYCIKTTKQIQNSNVSKNKGNSLWGFFPTSKLRISRWHVDRRQVLSTVDRRLSPVVQTQLTLVIA